MKKIKIGIIGCGSITEKRHAPEYRDNPNVEIIAFYDINKKRAELMAEMFGGKAVDDYMEIGYITHNKAVLGRFGQYYIGILKEYTKKDS